MSVTLPWRKQLFMVHIMTLRLTTPTLLIPVLCRDSTAEVYSTRGLTSVWYATPQTPARFVLMFPFKKLRVLLLLEVILLMLLRATPRYRTVSRIANIWLCIVYWLLMGCLDLLICMITHLLGLNSIAHKISLFWSRFKLSCNCCGPPCFPNANYTALSSTNRRNRDYLLSGKSFMYRRNRMGPNTEPWNTRDVTDSSSERLPSAY